MDIFKSSFNLEDRKAESLSSITKYPGRIPVFVSEINSSNIFGDKCFKKIMTPHNINFKRLQALILSRMEINSFDSYFFSIKNKSNRLVYVSSSMTIGELYTEYSDEDGFLYIILDKQHTFG